MPHVLVHSLPVRVPVVLGWRVRSISYLAWLLIPYATHLHERNCATQPNHAVSVDHQQAHARIFRTLHGGRSMVRVFRQAKLTFRSSRAHTSYSFSSSNVASAHSEGENCSAPAHSRAEISTFCPALTAGGQCEEPARVIYISIYGHTNT